MMARKSPQGTWLATIRHERYPYYMGTFETERRAEIAELLAYHWLKAGSEIGKIPFRNKTKDAI